MSEFFRCEHDDDDDDDEMQILARLRAPVETSLDQRLWKDGGSNGGTSYCTSLRLR